ncbi:MAG: hypothetical protein MZV63_41540, partial [Marinilabiliales bacterium]|nr:hypothetical protein [Marinilabiliales bacterium]
SVVATSNVRSTGIQRSARVETPDPFRVGIRDHRHGVVPDHAPVLVAVVRSRPERFFRALAKMSQHRIECGIGRPHGPEPGEKRVQRPIGVPEREDGIAGKVFRGVDLLDRSRPAPKAVHILEDRRADKRVVKCGVEDCFLFVRSLDHYPAQL